MLRKRLVRLIVLSVLLAPLGPALPAAAQAAGRTEPIIIDNTTTDIAQVPEVWTQAAKERLRVWYGRASHGSQITVGMGMLWRDFGDLYSFSHSGIGGSLSQHEPSHAGYIGRDNNWTAWEEFTRSALAEPGVDRNVVLWAFSGNFRDATEAIIDGYLAAMSRLEEDYPEITFVYMTGPLAGDGPEGNVAQRNNQIRDYVRANNKVLYDFAAIESYDPDGNYYPDGSDQCEWCGDWCAAHAEDCAFCGDCPHSRCLNCYLKAKAFWWLLARLAGWGGPGDDSEPEPGVAEREITPPLAAGFVGDVFVEAVQIPFFGGPALRVAMTNTGDRNLETWAYTATAPAGAAIAATYGGVCTIEGGLTSCDQDEYTRHLASGQVRESILQLGNVAWADFAETELTFNGEPVAPVGE